MKISPQKIDSFIKSPEPSCIAVLLYGPNAGLIQERERALIRTLLQDQQKEDPFQLIEITGGELSAEPARLVDEIRTFSFFQNRKIIRLRGVGDNHVKSLALVLEPPNNEAFLVLTSNSLGPKSKLRLLFESTPSGVAMPCYEDDKATLLTIIEKTLDQWGLRASGQALSYLETHLGDDRMIIRMELEKLALYKQGEAFLEETVSKEQKNNTIDLEDVEAIIGNSQSVSMEEVAQVTANGDRTGLDRTLHHAFFEGASPIQILRAVSRYFQRLYLAAGFIQEGLSPSQAMKRLRPPVFFKLIRSFSDHLRIWPPAHITRTLYILTQAETDCKTTGLPAQAICHRALMRIAQAAHKQIHSSLGTR